jgi:CDP-paratose 2-epimerase
MMRVLVTGGAGFVGTNLASALVRQGHEVVVLDNLSRAGVEVNVRWLQEQHPTLKFLPADIRNYAAVEQACQGVDQVFHLAAQVAVTTSVTDPRTDFEVNLGGTLNLLEAVRHHSPGATVFYTSTNKVYGGMEDLVVEQCGERYEYRDLKGGITEDRPLDFHSPYGCSKGGADQYVRDYGRIYGLKTVVFRMSCIYGPHQCGNEDQGWVAHFVRSALTGKGLNIYGDGRQVRDILYVDDLVRAFQLAAEHSGRTAGQVYNIGGGPRNTVSLLELLQILRDLSGKSVPVAFSDWRPGDQPVYVSSTGKAQADFGWQPQVSREEGVRCLYEWMRSQVSL